MMSPPIPADPFALVPHVPVEAIGEAERTLFGAPVSVLSLPRRTRRRGIPTTRRPPFQENRVEAILATEAVWRGPGMAMTGNAFPFADRQLVLWATERRREPTLAMLEAAFAMEDAAGGSCLINTMGAAASMTRSHIHLLGEASPFLAALGRSPIDPADVHLTPEQVLGCELVALDPPFPVVTLGLRGSARARARALDQLLECRTTPSFNVISSDGIAWLIPRSPVEIPAPYFPQALGGSEFWGRWCCNDHGVFERLTSEDLEAAIRLGGIDRDT